MERIQLSSFGEKKKGGNVKRENTEREDGMFREQGHKRKNKEMTWCVKRSYRHERVKPR